MCGLLALKLFYYIPENNENATPSAVWIDEEKQLLFKFFAQHH